MNTEDIMKYLGCAVLGLMLIYFVTVILKANNDLIGNVLKGKYREGLSNKDEIKKMIEKQININEKAIQFFNDMGADTTENSDLISKLVSTYTELVAKRYISEMIRGEGKLSSEKNTSQEVASQLTMLNEIQDFVDGGGGSDKSAKSGFFN